MPARKPQVFIFGWPTFLGGADTKLHHLLLLLHRHCQITLIPNDAVFLEQSFWTSLMDRLGVQYRSLDQLPDRLEGCALALCNDVFFINRIAYPTVSRGHCRTTSTWNPSW